MSLKEEIFLKLNPYSPPENDKWGINITQEVIGIIEKRIDSMIGIDNQTINRKGGTYEGRIAAQASKNALILVKEMLK